jgi:hypothetical protein
MDYELLVIRCDCLGTNHRDGEARSQETSQYSFATQHSDGT